MKKHILLISLVLFSLCLFGQENDKKQNFLNSFQGLVEQELKKAKTMESKRDAFDKLLDTIDSQRDSFYLSEEEVALCRKKAFDPYARLFVQYANQCLQNEKKKVDKIKGVMDEAERLLNLDIAENGSDLQNNLSDVLQSARSLIEGQRGDTKNCDEKMVEWEKEKKLLQNEIQRLKGDSIRLEKEKSDIDSLLKEEKKRMDRINTDTEVQKWRNNYEQLKNAVFSKNAVLLEQCLLYPLNVRYSPKKINDALSTISIIDSLGISNNSFNTYEARCKPLLEDYGLYNSQIISYLQTCITYIKDRQEIGGISFSLPVDDWKEDLMATQYYKKCYRSNNNIPYLNNRMDEIIVVFKNHRDVGETRKALEDIVKKMEPK